MSPSPEVSLKMFTDPHMPKVSDCASVCFLQPSGSPETVEATEESQSQDGGTGLGDQLMTVEQSATQVDTESEEEEGEEPVDVGSPKHRVQGPSSPNDTDESEPESDSATSDSESLASGNFDGPLSPTANDTDMDADAFPPAPTPAPGSDPALGPGPSTDSESGGESFSMSSDDEPLSGDQSPNMAPSSPVRLAADPGQDAMGINMEVEANKPLYEVMPQTTAPDPPKWNPTRSLLRVVLPSFLEPSVNIMCVRVQ